MRQTGNYYYGARYYNPKWSTWLSVDPLVEKTMDAYGYCYQNPINFVDPDGMEGDDWKTNAEGKLVYDENLTKENASTQLKEGESYVAESFVAKDQNGSVFYFNSDGSVEKSEADVTLLKASGIDTDSIRQVTSSIAEEGQSVKQPQNASGGLLGLVFTTAIIDGSTPDPTDVAAAPKALGYGAAAVAGLITGYLLSKSDVVMEFAHTPKKQSTGKSGSDRHSRQYTHGGKNRPKNPNRKRGAEERKNKGRDNY